MIGLACATASAADVETLMALAERDPNAAMKIDLKAGTCDAPGLRVAITTPAYVRDALMTGAWDTTALLRDRYDEVNAVAAKLPYLSGFSSPR